MYEQLHTCGSCDTEFVLMTPSDRDEQDPSYCPFCGIEMVEELDFD